MSGLRQIAVLGSGLAAWMAAGMLSRALRRLGTQVTLMTDPEEFSGDDGVLTGLPALVRLHDAMGFEPGDLARATGASLRLGTLWERTGGVHAYAPVGRPFGTVPFHLAWNAKASDPSPAGFAACSFAAQLGLRGAWPDDADAAADLQGVSPGLHLPAQSYSRFWQKAALHYGVKVATAPLAGFADPQDTVLNLQDGSQIVADLVIETRESASMDGFTPAPGLPAALYVSHTRREPRLPLGLARLNAVADAVRVAIPSRDFDVEITIGPEPVGRKLEPGYTTELWEGGVVRLGPAACVLPPVDGFALQIIQSGLEALLARLPGSAGSAVCRVAYNLDMSQTFAAMADFAALAFATAPHAPEDASASLRLRLTQFMSRGRVILTDGDPFNREDWLQAMIAAGWPMRRKDAHAAALPDERVRAGLAALIRRVAEVASTAPSQREWLDRRGVRPSPAIQEI